jgi:pyruvate dehydrogenase E2 component (dihydrolipoamide acetyltransferase)
MREAIAAAMSRSKREIPHYYLSTTADLSATVAWLADHNAAVPVAERLLFAALLVKSIALSCRELPGFSGFHVDGRYAEAPVAHVGVAVALRGGGLVAPAILNAADKPLPELMADFRGLVTRARAGRLRASELAAPTIILTSLGDSGIDAVFPIIQPPQVAIVGAGALVQRPGIVDGRIEPRQFLTVSLGADHRVTDGRLGARFLSRIVERLADPHTL